MVLEQHNPSWAIYTDNGTQFMRLRDNVVYDARYVPLAPHYLPGVSPYFSFGGCGGGPISPARRCPARRREDDDA